MLALVLLAACWGAMPAAAVSSVRVRAADDTGVTLELTTGDWQLGPPRPDGRVRITGLPSDAYTLGEPGRPQLPAFSAMLTLPPDATPQLRVLQQSDESIRDGVPLAIAGRPVFVEDPAGLGTIASMRAEPAIDEGLWPARPASLGAPTSFRGRRLVSIELRPFRYDASQQRVIQTRTLVVRIDFHRASSARAATLGSADRHVDPVLATTVLNWDQGRDWREEPRPTERRATSPTALSPERILSGTPTAPTVRVRIDTTGLYVLPYESLRQNSFPVGVPVAQVSVHRREYVAAPASGAPPYVRIELPIEVQDSDQNGEFGSGDLIWVYARDWATRSGASAYQRQWGDAEVLFVTQETGGGARVPHRAGWRGVTGLTPLASYPQRTRWEQNLAAYMPFVGSPMDTTFDLYHWTEITFYYNRPQFDFEIQDIDTSQSVQFSTQWIGRRFGSHNTFAAVLNGAGALTTVADSVRWSNKAPFTANSSVRGSAFSEGRTNRLRVWGKNASPSTPDPTTNASAGVGLNWFEASYWRRYRAVDDAIAFNSGDASGEVQLRVERFRTDSVRVYDVTDPLQPVRVVIEPEHFFGGSTATLEFQDSIATGSRRQYVAAGVQFPYDSTTGPATPPASAYSPAVDRLLWSAASGDYLLVAPEAFAGPAQQLADHRASQGLSVLHAPLASVYDEFNGGRPGPVAIQRFVRWAYDHWDSRFLLLMGDGTMDPRNFRITSGADWVPVLPTPGPVPVSEGYELVPSDNRYACLTGNCDPISGFGEVIPELMVGRLPVNSLAQAQAVVQKLIAYETTSTDEAWRRRVLLLSDDAYSGETFFGGGSTSSSYCHRDYEERFVTLAARIGSIVRDEAALPDMAVDQFDLRYFLPNEPFSYVPPADTCRPNRSETQTRTQGNVTPQLFGRLSQGALWWNYQGHANEFVLTHEDLYRNLGDAPGSDNKHLLLNDGKPFLFSAFSCHANMFARPENQNNPGQGASIGEDLVNLPDRGAVASWASVCFEVVPRDGENHVNVAMARAMFSDPPRDEVLGERGARVVLGEALLATYLRYLPTVQSYAYERGLATTYALLGDPATRLSIGSPQHRLLANAQLVAEDQPVRLHTLLDTLRLEARIASTVRIDSLGLYRTSSAGTVAVPATDYTLTPTFPDTAAASNQYGGRRFTLVHRTSLTPEPQQFTVVARDRDGRSSRITANFEVTSLLRVSGSPINDGDDVSPVADLSLLLLSPAPLSPGSDLTLTINGVPQPFQATAAPGDASGREWILTWIHDPYPIDDYEVTLTIAGGPTQLRRFRVTTAGGEVRLANLITFPNPFDSDGTAFSFNLLGSEPADARVSIFAISGRVLQSFVVSSLSPGYHQVRWDGRDAEQSEIANGVYFYRISVVTPSGVRTEQLGRLIKLRKPRRVNIEEEGTVSP